MSAPLVPEHLELVAEAMRLPGVVAVRLFGSRARGDARPDSDCDLGLWIYPSMSPLDYQALVLALNISLEELAAARPDIAAALGPFSTQLLNDCAKPALAASAVREGVLILDTHPELRKALERDARQAARRHRPGKRPARTPWGLPTF